MTATRPGPSPLSIEPIGDGYVPGVCNIGPWEARRRWAFGILGLAAAALLAGALIALHAPVAARALVLLPAWGGAFSVLQARRRFCGAYAIGRRSNFGSTYGTVRRVEDEAAHAVDMAALRRMLRDSFVVALALTVLAAAVPL